MRRRALSSVHMLCVRMKFQMLSGQLLAHIECLPRCHFVFLTATLSCSSEKKINLVVLNLNYTNAAALTRSPMLCTATQRRCVVSIYLPNVRCTVFRNRLSPRKWQILQNGNASAAVSTASVRSIPKSTVQSTLAKRKEHSIGATENMPAHIELTAIFFVGTIGTVEFSIASSRSWNTRSSPSAIQTVQRTIRTFRFV